MMHTFNEDTVRRQLAEHGVPEHTHEGIVRFLVHHVRPGEFLCSVLANDLVGAYRAADYINIRAMQQYASWMYACLPSRVHQQTPWGSYTAVFAWADRFPEPELLG